MKQNIYAQTSYTTLILRNRPYDISPVKKKKVHKASRTRWYRMPTSDKYRNEEEMKMQGSGEKGRALVES